MVISLIVAVGMRVAVVVVSTVILSVGVESRSIVDVAGWNGCGMAEV